MCAWRSCARKSPSVASRPTAVSSLTAKRPLLKFAGGVPSGSAPMNEVVHPHPARQAGCQRHLDYIAGDNIEAADRVLDALNNAMVRLAKSPGIGHWREEMGDKRHPFFFVFLGGPPKTHTKAGQKQHAHSS